ncbi:DUF2269 family protein [Cohnella endophytica]|uniref:DUF2269 family protein n=1 Tax=Cohnella endophytica TaxID=2419778 RepID=UPI001313DB6B|nr:DUF2269 family protein [Cohnella endophytica]
MSLNGYSGLNEDWLNALVFIHVLSAIIGIGPTYFAHVLLRRGQNFGQLRNSIGLLPKLEKFPKLLGSVAVLSGLLLAWLGDYGFKELWIYGSIAIYVLIQIVVIAFMSPAAQKLSVKVLAATDTAEQSVSPELAAEIAKVNKINYVATSLGVLLFLFMFFKPTL